MSRTLTTLDTIFSKLLVNVNDINAESDAIELNVYLSSSLLITSVFLAYVIILQLFGRPAFESNISASSYVFPSTIMLVRLLELWNTLSPIAIILFGIKIDIKLIQSENAASFIAVTLFGINIEDNLEYYENAEFPISNTLYGIMTFVKLLQLLNAYLSIFATLFGISILDNNVQFSNA